jgi:hypothetical protein
MGFLDPESLSMNPHSLDIGELAFGTSLLPGGRRAGLYGLNPAFNPAQSVHDEHTRLAVNGLNRPRHWERALGLPDASHTKGHHKCAKTDAKMRFILMPPVEIFPSLYPPTAPVPDFWV